MSITRHHNEWLSLVPNSGPFLSLPVLAQAFPQGLDAHDADHARRLRMAFDEWDDNQLGNRPDPGLHRAWMKFVLTETLGYDELLAEGQAIPQTLKTEIAEYGEPIRPDWVVKDPTTQSARLLVQSYPRSQSLNKPLAKSRSNLSPETRMMQLLRDTGIRLGIVTNGEHWMLVNAPKNETTGYISWYAHLWLEEKLTLRAFRTLLSAERFFGVQQSDTIESLLDRSADDQQEVTDQLGYQVRKAVKVLIQALDKADQDIGRKLLADVGETVLYEAALTVMMRLVFLFCAEERELLLLGDDLYDKNYAISTLREQLRATADQFGEENLGRRYDAWIRLLTTFRAVYGGADHDRLKLPAYGGSLFNPDRFTFLEGRPVRRNERGEQINDWRVEQASPLPVSNRTVLHLLEALQMLQVQLPGGGKSEARKLSFSELGIEQIGHVYEGLLDHTAKRATEPVLGLKGTRAKEPEIALAELERLKAKGEKELLEFLKDETGRSTVSPIKKALAAEIDDRLASRFRTACQDSQLWERVKPFAGLVRLDTTDYPVVITPGSVYVTAGSDRRSSGTHYTPKSLTEPIVEHTLDPLVYFGPAEGLPRSQWQLKTPTEILALKICDMACGSGAFLVQACRYLAGKLQEAWKEVERAVSRGEVQLFVPHPFASIEEKVKQPEPRTSPFGFLSEGKPQEQLLPASDQDREILAMRLIAQRCLYGVDKNPLAVEMAKLSLWLLTLAKDKPFEFLDHAIRCGDSLVGIRDLNQLRKFNLDGKGEDNRLFLQFLDPKIKEAIALRRQITEMQAVTVEDVEAQDRMLRDANEKIDRLKCAADFLIAAEFTPGSAADKRAARDDAAIKVALHFNDSDLPTFRREAQKTLNGQVTFHWPLEFPEVMVERGGFDAFVGNPPFISGKGGDNSTAGVLGSHYTVFLQPAFAPAAKSADLCAFFFRRAFRLVSNGTFGLLSTKTISEGTSRTTSLEYILEHSGQIYRAVTSLPWPGQANVFVSVVHVANPKSQLRSYLDGHSVEAIDAFLSSLEAQEIPFALQANANNCFHGTKPRGDFCVPQDDGVAILAADPSFSRVLRRYVRGQDIKQQVEPVGSEWIIDFASDSAHKPDSYRILFERCRKQVFEYRQKQNATRLRDEWWLFEYRADELYDAISGKRQVIAMARLSDHFAPTFVGVDNIFSDQVVIFPFQGHGWFAVLQSCFHETWCRRFASYFKGDLRYNAADCFVSFPLPEESASHDLEDVAQRYFQHRKTHMERVEEGLTKTYNRFHDSDKTDADIQRLRDLHVELDHAVAAAYGWTNLDLGHGFHETKQGVRYTISEPARREVLARLLNLNHERYAEEVKQGLHEKKKKPKATKTKARIKPKSIDPDLFAGEEDA